MQLQGLTASFERSRFFKVSVVVGVVFLVVSTSIFIHYYHRYTRIIDQRLNGRLFENTAKIYDGSGKLLTRLAGQDRAKRRLLQFEDIPKVFVEAVTAGEDQKFF